jgi:hypothetical protein
VNPLVRRSALALLSLSFASLPGSALAQDPPAAGVIFACLSTASGNVRIVAADQPCRNPETRVQWNIVGEPGPVGPQGPVGPMGPMGPQGMTGATGGVGPVGPVGPAGQTGSQGIQGPVGEQGVQGPIGPAGPVGPVGGVGPVGPSGPQGPKGDKGLQGLTGATGAIGPLGPVGPVGPIGPQGAKGDLGPIGPQGIQGPKGETGATGATGPRGPAGDPASLGPELTRTTGRIGINNTNPQVALDVNGSVRATGLVSWGVQDSRTEPIANAGDAGGRSGFFEAIDGGGNTNFYPGADSWQHLLQSRHSNGANNYALQIGGSFFDQDLWFRKTNNNAATTWSQLVGAGPRNCIAPFNAIGANATATSGGVTRTNTICGTSFFGAMDFQAAQETCFALGGHIPTYTEIYLIAKVNGLPSGNVMLNGDWIGNRVGDDLVLVVNNAGILNNFETVTNKNESREFRCVQSSTVVQ